jgi:hypothetical protein
MPIGKYPDIAACVADMTGKHGKESAEKICGAMKAKMEGKEERLLDHIIIEYVVPMTVEEKIGTKTFKVSGVAVEETTSRNGIRYTAEELRKAAPSLKGKPIIKDHNKSVDNIVGIVEISNFNDATKKLEFRGDIMDDRMKEMIGDGRIQNVSIGASVEQLIEESDGKNKTFTAKGINFEELSLVVVPGVQAATINQALESKISEALKIKEALNEVEVVENQEDLRKEVSELKSIILSLKPHEEKIEIKADESLKKTLDEQAAKIAKLEEMLSKKAQETSPKAEAKVEEVKKDDNFVVERSKSGVSFYRMPESKGYIKVN